MAADVWKPNNLKIKKISVRKYIRRGRPLICRLSCGLPLFPCTYLRQAYIYTCYREIKKRLREREGRWGEGVGPNETTETKCCPLFQYYSLSDMETVIHLTMAMVRERSVDCNIRLYRTVQYTHRTKRVSCSGHPIYRLPLFITDYICLWGMNVLLMLQCMEGGRLFTDEEGTAHRC